MESAFIFQVQAAAVNIFCVYQKEEAYLCPSKTVLAKNIFSEETSVHQATKMLLWQAKIHLGGGRRRETNECVPFRARREQLDWFKDFHLKMAKAKAIVWP